MDLKILREIQGLERAEKIWLQHFSQNICDRIFPYIHHRPLKRLNHYYDFLYTHALAELILYECNMLELAHTTESFVKVTDIIFTAANKVSAESSEKYAPCIEWLAMLLIKYERETHSK